MTASSPSLTDARPHAEAVKTALKAQLNDEAFDYDEVPGLNDVPGLIPDIFATLSVERRPGGPSRVTATTGRTGWRVAVRGMGRTVDECRWAMAKVAVALNETTLTVDGVNTTPIHFESDQAPRWDDGRYAAAAFYTYVH